MINEIQDPMAEILRLAGIKRHSLQRDMVDGSHTLSSAQMRMVLAHLSKCPDLPMAPKPAVPAAQDPGTAYVSSPAGSGEARIRQEPAARTSLPTLADLKDVPAGYFATSSRTGNNDLDFWRVDKPANGKWAGYSFAVRILGGGDGSSMRTIKLDNIQMRLALVAIRAAGFEEAGDAFADAIRRCKKCGLVLTDELSRERRMGMSCWKKYGQN